MHNRFCESAALAFVLSVAVASCTQASAPAEPAAPANPLHGVWSMSQLSPGGGEPTINPAQPGVFIFTEGHYSSVYSLGDQARQRSAVSFSPTPEEKVAQYDTILVNTGTFEVNGSTITFRPLLAKSPEYVGGQGTMEFQIDGDVLTLRQQSVVGADGVAASNASGASMTLRRIE